MRLVLTASNIQTKLESAIRGIRDIPNDTTF